MIPIILIEILNKYYQKRISILNCTCHSNKNSVRKLLVNPIYLCLVKETARESDN